jgi:hypothetical protein
LLVFLFHAGGIDNGHGTKVLGAKRSPNAISLDVHGNWILVSEGGRSGAKSGFFLCWHISERCLSIDLTIATGLIIKSISFLPFVIAENLPCLFLGKVSQKKFPEPSYL